MEIYIEALTGSYAGKSTSFSKSPIVIGTQMGCEIRLPMSDSVSPQQVKLNEANDQWWIANLDEAHPVLMNNVPLRAEFQLVGGPTELEMGANRFLIAPKGKISALDTSEQAVSDGAKELLIQEYVAFLRGVIVNGQISPEGWAKVRQKQNELRLNRVDIHHAHAVIYSAALKQSLAAGTFANESPQTLIGTLKNTLEVGELDDPLLIEAERDAKRFLIVHAITKGKVPKLDSQGLDIELLPNEQCHFRTQVSLLEERLGLHYLGNKSSSQVRIARGQKYRFGSVEAHSIGDRELKSLADGTLILSSKRIFFLEPQLGFDIPWIKVFTIHPYTDGFSMNISGKMEPYHFRYLDPAIYEIFAGIAQHCINAKA